MVHPPVSPERAAAGQFASEEEVPRGADYIDGVESQQQFNVTIGGTIGSRSEPVHVYRKFRCMLEELLSYYPNVLNLRVQFPVAMTDGDFSDKRSLLAKLKSFPKVDAAEVSVTFLEDLCPVIPVLAEKKKVGNLNFVNPGSVKYADVVERFSKHLEEYTKPEIRGAGGRGSILMAATELVAAVSDVKTIRTADECLDEIFGSIV